MLFKKSRFTGIALISTLLSGLSFSVFANTPSIDVHASLKSQLSSTIGVEVLSVKKSPINALVEVMTDQGLFYATHDGKHILHGKLYGLGDNVVNLTEESLAKVRIEGIEKFKDDMIVYPAKDEKYVINVFTDITCGYCRQMHQQMSEINDLGITVRYLAYPRAGLQDQTGKLSQGFKDLRSIWCHENPSQALTKAKQGSPVAQRICDKPVAEEFNFGRQVGVNATPAIIFDNGFLLPGYRQPKDLLKIIETINSAS